VTRRTKWIAVILGVLAMLFIAAWPIWKWLKPTPATVALFERTKAAVQKDPQLQPAWDRALEDGVLTWNEAKEILERAGEKVDPGE
jgi:hypothetical protein